MVKHGRDDSDSEEERVPKRGNSQGSPVKKADPYSASVAIDAAVKNADILNLMGKRTGQELLMLVQLQVRPCPRPASGRC